jgi:cobalamin biosynthesis protein CobD/CbiB
MTQLPDIASRRTRRFDGALRVIGFVIWFIFILFCVGLNLSHGLCCADDAWFAIIAKPLASGLGYATTFGASGEIAHPILFIVRIIDQRKQQAPTIVASRWWGSFADVEFSLRAA